MKIVTYSYTAGNYIKKSMRKKAKYEWKHREQHEPGKQNND